MNKTAIKNFSVWARKRLIGDITYKAGLLGITVDGIKEALPQSTKDVEFYDIGTKEPYQISGNALKQRKQLVEVIRQKSKDLPFSEAYKNIIEEVAYTWFNRLIAIRFMEVNDYLPTHIRVLSSDSEGKMEPDLVTMPFDAELDFTNEEEQYIKKLKNDNAVNELFQFLFIRQCNSLNDLLPRLFEKTADYTELLLHLSVTDQDGVVYRLTHDIEEKDFNIAEGGQVEIIGWMYQYYNTQPKDEAFALLKKNVKITKERIPAATQLFTPDWIVRYMVENSLGRLWLEGHENDNLKKEWKYYLDEAEQEADVAAQLEEIRKEYQYIKPEDIKIIDPCMGSGHILVYAFEVLMQIYESSGYSQRDAAKSIVENNIYGLDIDDRAFQLAYFAVMMKARQYNRRILTQEIEPNLCSIQESNSLKYEEDMARKLLGKEYSETLQYLLEFFEDAKEYGSILEVENRDYAGFLELWKLAEEQASGNILTILWYSELNKIVPTLAKQALFLAQKYDVVVTNPPYMGISNGDNKLNQFVKKNFPDSKSDLFAVFIEKCGRMVKENGYQAMITQHSWMFLSSFENMRISLVSKNHIVNMLHLGSRAFEEIGGEVVQTTSFVMRNTSNLYYKGKYIMLTEIQNAREKEVKFLTNNIDYTYRCNSLQFSYIEGSPIVYWGIENDYIAFKQGIPMENIAMPKQGSTLGNNDMFIRLWFEVINKSTNKWFKCLKGGMTRKWYGNHNYYVDWENDGERVKKYGHQTIRNADMLFKEGISWSRMSNSAFRIMEKGFFFESASGVCYPEKSSLYYILGFLNTKVSERFSNMINPTLHFQSGDLARIPIILSDEYKVNVEQIVKDNVLISVKDWDSFEISWDFKCHPLIQCASFAPQEIEADAKCHIVDMGKITDAYDNWSSECNNRFNTLKANEEQLNKIFIDIYGLQDELSPEVEDKDVTVRKADLKREIKSLLSYAIGCMFGRYSLQKEGLMFAGGEMEDIYQFHSGKLDGSSSLNGMFPMDGKSYYYLENDDYLINASNIIPITDEEYLEDDIVSLLCIWLKKAYGQDTLEENLDFIASALDNKGNTSREVIRNYFLKDFFKDHCATYSVTGSGKRPIYWLFDSGKQNGFKALIYMHRYNADTIGNIRVDYLHRIERIYESEIHRMQDTIDHSNVAREITTATKRKEKLQKQLKECREFDEKIGHLALSRIAIDLDDGVKVNYEKIQTANDGKKYQVLAKI